MSFVRRILGSVTTGEDSSNKDGSASSVGGFVGSTPDDRGGIDKSCSPVNVNNNEALSSGFSENGEDDEQVVMFHNLDTGQVERMPQDVWLAGGALDAQFSEEGVAYASDESITDLLKGGEEEEEQSAIAELGVKGESDRVSKQARVGALLIRSLLFGRTRVLLAKSFSRWYAARESESEEEHYAEQISAKNAACAVLMEENQSLRVQHEQALRDKEAAEAAAAAAAEQAAATAERAAQLAEAAAHSTAVASEKHDIGVNKNNISSGSGTAAAVAASPVVVVAAAAAAAGAGTVDGEKRNLPEQVSETAPGVPIKEEMFTKEEMNALLVAKGVDPAIIFGDKEGKKKEDTRWRSHPDYAEYFKMLSVKVPRGAVEAKMRSKGLDPEILDRGDEQAAPAAQADGLEDEQAEKKLTTTYKTHPDYAEYFKMLSVKVPRGAVEAKMVSKGLDPKVLDTPDDQVVEKEEKKEKPTWKEHPDYMPFFKMLAVKVPRGAVEAKMVSKGLDPKVLDVPDNLVVVEKEQQVAEKEQVEKILSYKEHPDYEPFFKMLAVKVPRGAVEGKMISKGFDPKVLDTPDDPAVSKEDGKTKKKSVMYKDHPDYAPFFKMLVVKVPIGAVANKMVAKGLDPKVLDTPDGLVPEEDDVKKEKQVPYKDHPDYSPFFKMLAVKVPRVAVEGKMLSKGLDPKALDTPDALCQEGGGGGSSSSSSSNLKEVSILKRQGLQKAAAGPAAPLKPKPDKIVRRKLHWRKLVGEKAEQDGAVWAKVQRFVFEQREVSELTRYFSVNVSEQERRKAAEKKSQQADSQAEQEQKSKAAKKKKEQKIAILETLRQNNVGIGLARMKNKGVDAGEIRRCLFSLELSDDVALDDVRSALSLLPTPEEEKLLNAYKGPPEATGPAEQYFLALLDIPRYKQRIKCFLYKARFEEAVDDARFDLAAVSKACREVLEEKSFKRLLEVVLALGNFMNEGADVPSNRLAQGFAIEALNKLRDVRSFQDGTTALHYLVLIIQSREAQVLTYIQSQTNSIRQAANVSLSNAQAQVATLGLGIKAVETEHKLMSKIVADPEQRESISEEDTLFILGLNKFYTFAIKELADLQAESQATNKAFETTLNYLCEDPATQSEALFRTLQTFFLDFEKAFNENAAMAKRIKKRLKEKKQAKQRTTKSSKKKHRSNSSLSSSSSKKA